MSRAQRFWFYLLVLLGLLFVAEHLTSQQFDITGLGFEPLFLAPLLLFHLLYLLAASKAWQRAITCVCPVQLQLFDALVHTCALNLGKYVPGKVWGMLARGLILGSRCRPAAVSAATVQEQASLLHSGAILATALAGLLISPLFWVATGVLLLLAFRVGPWGRWALRIAARRFPTLAGFDGYLLNTREYLSVLGWHLLVWLLLGSVLAMLELMLLGGQPDMLRFGWILLANTIGVAAGFVAVFAPGGIGVREGITASLLTAVMPLDQAVLLTVLFRFWITGAELLGGALLVRPAAR